MRIQRHDIMDISSSNLSTVAIDPLLCQILYRRGISKIEDMDTSLKGLLSPYSLLDIDKAASIIAQSIMNQEHIMISGDYDIDGMTGTALGVRCLKAFGLDEQKITYFVPSRYDDGYGLNQRAISYAQAQGVQLIVTVDNGIAAFDAIDFANECGIKVVVTDHHEMLDRIPNALAVVDPKRKGDPFESKNLSGVGVLFYVMIAVRAKLIELGYYDTRAQAPNLSQFLDLVLLGTVGDIMSFDSNNRRLIKSGLARIHQGQCSLGLKVLLSHLKIDYRKLTIRNIAFDLCPRFNAATRLKLDDNPAILCLLTDREDIALLFAKNLDLCNRRRMDHEKEMCSHAKALYQDDLAKFRASLEEAGVEAIDVLKCPDVVDVSYQEQQKIAQERLVDSHYGKHGIAIYDPMFLTGLVGLVANKLKESYKCPCIVFGADVGAGKQGPYEMMTQLSELKKQELQNNPDQLASFVESSLSIDEAKRIYREQDPLISTRKIVGSARSVKGVNLIEVFNYIKACDPNIFIACGGHAMAAGASIYAKDIERFKLLFNEACASVSAQSSEDYDYISDGELSERYFCKEFALDLENLGPWGKDFEEPKFDGVFTVDGLRVMGKNTLRVRLKTANNFVIEGIKFKSTQKERDLQINSKVQVVYSLGVDRFNNNERLQMTIDALELVA